MFRIDRGLVGLFGLDWLIVSRVVCRLLVFLALNNHDRHPIAEFLLNRSFDWPWWCCELVQDVEMIKVVKVVASFLPSVSKFRVEKSARQSSCKWNVFVKKFDRLKNLIFGPIQLSVC